MKSIYLFLMAAVCTAIFFPSCYYDDSKTLYGVQPCDSVNVTYSGAIVNILETNCYVCHRTDNADILGGGNNLEGYENLMDYVVPGDPANSLFYGSVAWLPGYLKMPRPEGTPQLSECDIAIIRKWINDGAVSN